MKYLNENVLDFFLFQSKAKLMLASITEPGLKIGTKAYLQSPVL